MIVCPHCDALNIDGVDTCQDCGQPLDFLSKPRPRTSFEARVVKSPISVLWPQTPVAVPPGSTVGEVLKTMVDRSIGCVVIVDHGQVVGIFSERDVLRRLGPQARELAHRPISEFMTPGVETLRSEDRIAYALHRMDVGGFRHVPITTDGQLTGIISVRDILRYITAQVVAHA